MKKALVVCHVGRHFRKFGHYDIKTLQELGYEVHFASNFNLDIDKVDDKSLILHQIDFQRNPFSLKNISAYNQMKKLLKENSFDLVHCQSPVGGVITRLVAKKYRKIGLKVLYTAHGFHFYRGASIINWLLFYSIEKRLSKYTDVIITINKEDYALAKTKFLKCKNIKYVPGVGVDLTKFNLEISEKEKISLRKSLGLNKSDFVLIFPSRLDKNKNQVFLINAMKKLIANNKNIHLLLPGEDDLNGYYQKIANNLGLKKNIHFLGYRTDISKLLKISDIAVSSSLREGLPLNVIEAFACGLPVVSLNCRGMRDLIIDGKNGYIVYNEKYFVDKVLYLINNSTIFRNISRNNSIKAKKFSIPVIKEIFKKIINE